MQWLLLSSFDGPSGNSKYIASPISLTMYILLLFKYFSSWTGFLLHFQGCVLFSRKYICWSIYSTVGYSSWILNVIYCDTELFLLSMFCYFFSHASVKLFAVFHSLSGCSLPIFIIPYFPEHVSTPQACKKVVSLQLNPQTDAGATGVNKIVSILASHGQPVQRILLWTDH